MIAVNKALLRLTIFLFSGQNSFSMEVLGEKFAIAKLLFLKH